MEHLQRFDVLAKFFFYNNTRQTKHGNKKLHLGKEQKDFQY